MMLAFGAAASALDSLFGLASAKPAQPAGSGQDHANLFAFQRDAANASGPPAAPAAGGAAQISPETMSALLAAQSQSGSTFKPMGRQDALKHLFSQIDADGDGKIAKGEFEEALGAGGGNLAQADEVFGKLDRDSDGAVSLGEMASALKVGNGRPHMAGAGDDSGDPLLQALQGASGAAVTDADGSNVTRPSASGASAAASSSYNFLEQLMQRQANAIAARTNSSRSVSV